MSAQAIAVKSRDKGLNNDGDHDDHRHDDAEFRALSGSDTVVRGHTIAQWAQEWTSMMIHSPLQPPNGRTDPQGIYAAQINHPGSPMYFITGDSPTSSTVRAFHVNSHQDVFLPIIGQTDMEGPGIAPTIPNFQGTPAEHVQTVLSAYTFNATLSVDGKPVTDLLPFETGIFSSGKARPGSVATDPNSFGADPGAKLGAVGTKGYAAVLSNLSEGSHQVHFTGTAMFFGNTVGSLDKTITIVVD